jgi:hypothetical protein
MRPDQIARVRRTWTRLLHAPDLALVLAPRLDAAAPRAVALLAAAGVSSAADEIVGWIDYAMWELDRIPALAAALDVFGRDYADLGVTPEDVAGVRAAVFGTLADLLGADFDAATLDAWAAGFTPLAAAFARALCPASAPTYGPPVHRPLVRASPARATGGRKPGRPSWRSVRAPGPGASGVSRARPRPPRTAGR